jgi:(p)ppGpp synthase/HD superfamily hydrolase
VGILRACMAAYDSTPPGDYVVLCEGDSVIRAAYRLHTDGGNAMMEQ